jgi:hypothetical protein
MSADPLGDLGLRDPDQPTPQSHAAYRERMQAEFTPEERAVIRATLWPHLQADPFTLCQSCGGVVRYGIHDSEFSPCLSPESHDDLVAADYDASYRSI